MIRYNIINKFLQSNYKIWQMDDKFSLSLSQCKTLILINMEKGIQSSMIYRYLKQTNLVDVVKKYEIKNEGQRMLQLQFCSHKDALAFYNEANFIAKILVRPFNISFKLQLPEDLQYEQINFFIEGVTNANTRSIFEVSRKLGLCKINIFYQTLDKLKPQGIISIIRRYPLQQDQLDTLRKELEKHQVKIIRSKQSRELESAHIKQVKNSYKILFANGIQNIFSTEDQLKQEFAKVLSQVNANVENVQLLPKGNLYSAKIYLKEEEDGRDFLVDYSKYRGVLVDFFSNKRFKFNIFIDYETINKNKAIQKRIGQISKNIKQERQNEALYKAQSKRYNQAPRYDKYEEIPEKSYNRYKPKYEISTKTGIQKEVDEGKIIRPSIDPGEKTQQQANQKVRQQIRKIIERKKVYEQKSKEDKQLEQNMKKTFFSYIAFILKNDLCRSGSSSQISSIVQNILEKPLSLIISFMEHPQENFEAITKAD